MQRIFIAVIALITAGCASQPRYPLFESGQRVSQPGISFIAPSGSTWSVFLHTNYQFVLARNGKTPNESYIVNVSVMQLPALSSNAAFLEHVKKGRTAEPQTGRFEVIRNSEELGTQRKETCVMHRSISKDFGAKRGGDYTIYETYGMNCIHPSKPQIGMFIELSRKAPPDSPDPGFEQLGVELLASVRFNDFR
jgi:hypothetical protein